jgi:hypothetical protein
MTEDLHRSIWSAYRRAIGADARWDAAAAFQTALDVYLQRCPNADAASACREAARMIMLRPRGVGNRGRIIAPASEGALAREGPFVAVARFLPTRAPRGRR